MHGNVFVNYLPRWFYCRPLETPFAEQKVYLLDCIGDIRGKSTKKLLASVLVYCTLARGLLFLMHIKDPVLTDLG